MSSQGSLRNSFEKSKKMDEIIKRSKELRERRQKMHSRAGSSIGSINGQSIENFDHFK